jgi:hypothetical protein
VGPTLYIHALAALDDEAAALRSGDLKFATSGLVFDRLTHPLDRER